MPAFDTLRRVPRFPHVWGWCLLASQALVVWLWVRFGWQVGLPAMVLSHAPFWWATLVPDSALFSPVLRRLDTEAQVAWLTIDDGPSSIVSQATASSVGNRRSTGLNRAESGTSVAHQNGACDSTIAGRPDRKSVV